MGAESETRKTAIGAHLASIVALTGGEDKIDPTKIEVRPSVSLGADLAEFSGALTNAQNHAGLSKLKKSRADTKAPLPGKPQMVHNKHRH